MNCARMLRVCFLSMALITLGLSSQSAFAGGAHGGGGGFHGGGGGFHGGGGGFHGGGFGAGGFHGGGGGGFHGGYNGWHGGHGWGGGYGWGGGWRGGWGYPGYCCGWGFGLSFNFGGPWWGYDYPAYTYVPYPYYYPYYAYPYPYPYYYAPVGNVSADGYSTGPAQYTQADSSVPRYAPLRQQSGSVPRPAPTSNSIRLYNASYTQPTNHRVTSATTHPSYRPAVAHEGAPMRPEVTNVIRALRGMPPDARQRAIDSGRYNNFSPQELKLVRYAASLPPA